MLNTSIQFLIKHKIIALLLLLISIGFGWIYAPIDTKVSWMPNEPIAVDAIPDLGENQQIIVAEWEGRSPQDIEDQITYPLTTALLGIPGVKTIRSSSMFGVATIYLIFEEEVEFYWSRSRILEKLNALPPETLPQGVRPALGPDATGLGQVFWYTLEGRDTKGEVTGGWDLQELRTLQDTYVKYGLATAQGVAEVASIGGYVKEYQIDVHPAALKKYQLTLLELVAAIRAANKDVGAKTIEINQAEYIVRGLGSIASTIDIEQTVIRSDGYTPITVADVATVSIGPAARRGILDKEGAEVVGGVAIARYGANPMQVISNVKEKIAAMQSGMPSKTLADGRRSTVTIVPFYDRSELIHETLDTLYDAITLELLITILVIILMVRNTRASLLITMIVPISVLLVFIAMKVAGVTANIVALSGIAIAIGTMVDIGVIVSENIVRHLEKNQGQSPINTIVYQATKEVAGAIITAVLTTIISFLPIFMMVGAEGKLFRPLAFTKTAALTAALLVTLAILPPLATMLFKKRPFSKTMYYVIGISLLIIGSIAIANHVYIGILIIAFGAIECLRPSARLSAQRIAMLQHLLIVGAITTLLAYFWKPLGVEKHMIWNFLFVAGCCAVVLGGFTLFRYYYESLLRWALQHKVLFLALPLLIVAAGVGAMLHTDSEFMPSLDEGSFLLMPTSLPHAGVEANKRVLQQLDRAVASIPEVETVVGKAGRINSALDPAPLSMYENIIHYKPEYVVDTNGNRQLFSVDETGAFVLKNGSVCTDQCDVAQLIPASSGAYYRNWRSHIQTPDDIWQEILAVTRLPGVTAAPKLQPIETRLLMLQTGMRTPIGIKIKGTDLDTIASVAMQLEALVKTVEGVQKEAVFADRVIGKPYLLIDIDRKKAARYGASIDQIQQTIAVAIGGATLTHTQEGRERYGVRVRYPRAFRDTPEAIQAIEVALPEGRLVPLASLANIHYKQGPQLIKSEDTFLVAYVLLDAVAGYTAETIVENTQKTIDQSITDGTLRIPQNVNYEFTGTYIQQRNAEKTLAWVIPLALLSIFLILYAQFRSVSTTCMVFVGVAVALAGGMLLIWLYGQHWFMDVSIFGIDFSAIFQIKTVRLSVAVWVGFIALFGIATDDGVVMATYLTQTFATEQPTTTAQIQDLVVQAGKKRIRACLLTTATTILALLPVLTATGRGSDILIPMAIPTFGGMLVAVITLCIVPVLYSWKVEYVVKKQQKNAK